MGHALAPLIAFWPHLRGCLEGRQLADNGWVRLGGPIGAKMGILLTKIEIVSLYVIIYANFICKVYS